MDYYPMKWKSLSIILIVKGNDEVEQKNFRPVCHLNVFGKLFEHLIKKRLEEKLMEKQVLLDTQFGFR